jgi:hypothetical protein
MTPDRFYGFSRRSGMPLTHHVPVRDVKLLKSFSRDRIVGHAGYGPGATGKRTSMGVRVLCAYCGRQIKLNRWRRFAYHIDFNEGLVCEGSNKKLD